MKVVCSFLFDVCLMFLCLLIFDYNQQATATATSFLKYHINKSQANWCRKVNKNRVDRLKMSAFGRHLAGAFGPARPGPLFNRFRQFQRWHFDWPSDDFFGELNKNPNQAINVTGGCWEI